MESFTPNQCSDADLDRMINRLSRMSSGNKRPSDGKGIYLGDGLPFPDSCSELRSNVLLQALQELKEHRGKA